MQPADVLSVIRQSGGITRNQLIARTGLGRSTVAQRVDALLERELVREIAGRTSTGGGPPTTIVFNPAAAVLRATDLGATHARLALTDLSGEPLHEERGEIAISEGPDTVLGWVSDTFEAL